MDAFVPLRDAGSGPDLGASCEPAAIDLACTRTGNAAVPVGVPYALPVYFGAASDVCFCSERPACQAQITGDGVLSLETALCGRSACEACIPQLEGTCALPPLAAGTWRVRVNGRDAFELLASDAFPITGPVDVCATVPSEPGCSPDWPPVTKAVDELCHDVEVLAGAPIPIALTDFCRPCGDALGPCLVTRTANTLQVTATRRRTQCDLDCFDVCERSETRCAAPPLEPGTYSVSVAGLPGSTTLHVLAGGITRPGRACNSLRED